jgi:hypothetical protein
VEPSGNGVSPRVLDEIDRIAGEVDATGRGRLVLVRGEPGPGLSRLLTDHLAQHARVLAGGFDVAGARGEFVAPPRADARAEHPDELLALLRDQLADGRTLVLVLGDIDRALPPVRWCDLFLLHLLPTVLRASRLVVIATAATSSQLGADEGTDGLIEELSDEGIATTITGASTSLGETAGEEARIQLRRPFEHLGDAPADRAYDVAVRTLRVAALEGPEFTVTALARALDVDEDALSDWLDDYLVTDEDRPDAPLDGLGFFDTGGTSLYRYGFRNDTFWSVMHPVHGAAAWPASPPSRRLARRYADALVAAYGPASTEAAFRIWDLARLGGAEEDAYYASPVHATADPDDYIRLLAAEAETADESRSPRRLLAAARRIAGYLRPVAFIVPGEALLGYARLSQSLLERVAGAPADAWTETYAMLGLSASRVRGWVGDAARCEALSIELVAPEDAHALTERLTSLATMLLEIVHQDYELIGADWLEATGAHLGLAVPWLDELFADRSTAPAKVVDSAADLLQRAEAALARLPSEQRTHLQAHLDHALARLQQAQGDPASASRSERRALALLDQEAETPCNLRVLALLGLADHLEATGDLRSSAEAAREGTRHALARADADDAARALGALGRLTLALDEPEEARGYLALGLLIGHGRDVPVAAGDRWAQLGRTMARLERPSEALDCFALAVRTFAGADRELKRIAADAGIEVTAPEVTEALRRADERRATPSDLAFLEEITGIGEEQTNTFLAEFR